MQKKVFLTLIATLLQCHAYHDMYTQHHYMQPPQPYHLNVHKPTHAPASFRTKRKPAHSTSFILASLYGVLSGYLCRTFEREALHDVPPFRLINLLVWGHLQGSLLQTIIDDLKEENVGLSDNTMKRSAWILSWLAYLLS